MLKPHITRTLGPTHFEDLDPHRFEDLVRQLCYDFKQWQSIESTGRGGADDGFDVRGFEVISPSIIQDDEDNQENESHPMEGNLWMIQCKREKELGPARVASIIREAVNPDNPPFGYILAAPAHFSKAAHDKFRDELRNRGVMEFYLWGAGELEDMLYQPKNDHILFAFFGISLTSRRRSRTTEVRAAVNIKNKLLRIWGDDPSHQPILLRDLLDTEYPYEGRLKDFEKFPRWKHYSALEFHPHGIVVSVAKHYAYIDEVKFEWDYTEVVNTLLPPQSHSWIMPDDNNKELQNAVKGYWEQLPHANRAEMIENGLIRFDSIALIDEKGDSEYDCPHLFIDFHSKRNFFSGRNQYLEINTSRQISLEKFKRVKVFPEVFPKSALGKIYKDKLISVDDKTKAFIKRNMHDITIYSVDGKYRYLKPMDIIGVDGTEDHDGKRILLKITNIRVITGKKLQDACKDDPFMKQEVERQIPRTLKTRETIQILEAIVIRDWQIQQNRSGS